MATARARRLIARLIEAKAAVTLHGVHVPLSDTEREVAARALRWVLRTGSVPPWQPFFVVNREHLRDAIRALEGRD